MCISDGFATEICEKFTLSIEDPIKESVKKKELSKISTTVQAPRIQ
jgi:hypothetical protein